MIDSFSGRYEFLSNFSSSPIEMEGIVYPTVEHAYQASKTTQVGLRERMSRVSTPGLVKKEGRLLNLRRDWEDVKLGMMERCLVAKFSYPDLRQALLDTGDEELIEGNWWGDTYWGMCNGVGQNHLGRLLMKIRQVLHEEIQVK